MRMWRPPYSAVLLAVTAAGFCLVGMISAHAEDSVSSDAVGVVQETIPPQEEENQGETQNVPSETSFPTSDPVSDVCPDVSRDVKDVAEEPSDAESDGENPVTTDFPEDIDTEVVPSVAAGEEVVAETVSIIDPDSICAAELESWRAAQYVRADHGIRITAVRIESDEDVIIMTNTATTPVSLDGWKIRKRTASRVLGVCDGSDAISGKKTLLGSTDSLCTIGEGCGDADIVLNPGDTLVWTGQESGFAGVRIVNGSRTKRTLAANNVVVLLDDAGRIADAVAWGVVADSFDAIPADNPGDDAYVAVHDGIATVRPVCESDLLRTVPCVPPYDGSHIIISEAMPNPAGDDADGEWVELRNPGDGPVDLHGWILGDATVTGRYRFPTAPDCTARIHRRPAAGLRIRAR